MTDNAHQPQGLSWLESRIVEALQDGSATTAQVIELVADPARNYRPGRTVVFTRLCALANAGVLEPLEAHGSTWWSVK